MTGAETLWPSVLLALVLLLVGLVVLALGIVVPLALAVAKAAFVGWAARAVLGRLAAEKHEQPRRAPAPVGASVPPEHEKTTRKPLPAPPPKEKRS